MKIGFVLDDGLDKPDGVQQYILSLGGEFLKQGHEVCYLVGETKYNHSRAKIYSLAKNIKVRFNGNALSIPLPASNAAIKKVLKAEKFDVLHVQVPYSPFMGAKVVKYSSLNTLVIGTFHILPYGLLSRIGTRLLGVTLRTNLRRFDSFMSVSSPAAEFAAETFKISSRVIPNMVDINKFKGNVQAYDKHLKMLFLGRLVYRKGCLQLLKACALLRSQGKLSNSAKLDICGEGPMRKELKKFVSDNGLAGSVEFHGYVTEEQKIEFMRKADISVFPSLSGESFGIVLIEAMAAAGGVVLAGDNPGYKSVMGGISDSLFNPREPFEIAKNLGAMIEDKAKRQQLFKIQQKHVEQFDTQEVASRVFSVYELAKNNKSINNQ